MNYHQHILRTQQFDRSWLESFFLEVAKLKDELLTPESRMKLSSLLCGRLMFSVFFEPSTRTKFSFETAAFRLGMARIVTENAGEFSSAVKGETLEHTIRVLAGYKPDVIVLRHKETGAAERTAHIASEQGVYLINAGDGTGQHPTQALTDVFTVFEHFKTIAGKHIVVGGDLAYGRTVKSLVYLLAKFSGMRFTFISHPSLIMDAGVLQHLREHKVPFEIITDSSEIDRVFPEADVIYWTRTQSERIAATTVSELSEVCGQYRIKIRQARLIRPNSIILHPLPIAGEVAMEVDKHPGAHYFQQSDNGVPVRMALLKSMLVA